MWNDRYNTDDYAYGKTPNAFLAERFAAIPRGRVLSLAEGEGRNAVFLAKQGYAVTAVDGSAVGLAKARALAGWGGVAACPRLLRQPSSRSSLGGAGREPGALGSAWGGWLLALRLHAIHPLYIPLHSTPSPLDSTPSIHSTSTLHFIPTLHSTPFRSMQGLLGVRPAHGGGGGAQAGS